MEMSMEMRDPNCPTARFRMTVSKLSTRENINQAAKYRRKARLCTTEAKGNLFLSPFSGKVSSVRSGNGRLQDLHKPKNKEFKDRLNGATTIDRSEAPPNVISNIRPPTFPRFSINTDSAKKFRQAGVPKPTEMPISVMRNAETSGETVGTAKNVAANTPRSNQT
jgi:hypothetical protein